MAANPKMLRRAAQAAADDVLQQLFGHHILVEKLGYKFIPTCFAALYPDQERHQPRVRRAGEFRSGFGDSWEALQDGFVR